MIGKLESGELELDRLLIRQSGPDPLLRVMAEGEDERLLLSLVDGIVDEVTAAAG